MMYCGRELLKEKRGAELDGMCSAGCRNGALLEELSRPLLLLWQAVVGCLGTVALACLGCEQRHNRNNARQTGSRGSATALLR